MKVFTNAKVFQTQGIADEASKNGDFSKEVLQALGLFCNCNWGEVCTEDSLANDEALASYDRVLAAYPTSVGKIWITAESNTGNEYTHITILFPDEY